MFWQIFRQLSELGAEIILIPTRGKAVKSLWWRVHDNPISEFSLHSLAMAIYKKRARTHRIRARTRLYEHNSDHVTSQSERRKPSTIVGVLKDMKDGFWSMSYQIHWEKYLERIYRMERGIDVIIQFSDLLHYMRWLPEYVHKHFGIPVIAYNADLPTYLWSEESFRMSSLYDANIAEYDAFITNSRGVVNKLRALGASQVYTLDFGVDPHLFSPLEVNKDIDVSFYGFGAGLREDAMNWMITRPSKKLRNLNFRTAGYFGIDLGFSKSVGRLSFASMKRFCCRSKITLNITRKTFAETYCSSTARPFELAAMKCCMVSNPVKGMEEWFTPGKEFFKASNEREAIELYQWLIPSEEVRYNVGRKARQKVLQKHTYKHRAKELLGIVNKLT